MWWLFSTGTIVAFLLFVYSFFRRSMFAFLLDRFNSPTDSNITVIKKSFFESLRDVVSSDPELKKSGRFRLLEIGVGTGLNFEFYPSNARISVLEPNSNFKRYVLKNKQKFPDVELENFFLGVGEDMKSVPSGSMDVVVCTHVMCSVQPKNMDRFLSEVKRVLATNGRFYFFEHVGDRPGTWRRWVQNMLQATFLYGFITCDCIPNKDTEEMVQKAGFSSVDITRFYLQPVSPLTSAKGFSLRILASHIRGIAIK
ncbi:unnamed protein product [Darwinula stevensoni]|uniref:Methyltransferase type 11 domain-containing protein n=1 Tax=Darwinula stevensoni TaxID=69355 RepID=A0A7R8X7F6_9CRUS|nr:unnamed protein product [Darwinula stevensoni]CAG0888625.1 unnamed protein product [Darwinula stevensoni]